MTAVEFIAQHIISHLSSQRPLFVAVQGPQGSGKSYLTAHIQKLLQSPPHSLHVVVFSLDDLYLPHEALVSLSTSQPQNVLWQGRGQPGTHDVELGVRILHSLRQGNGTVELPRFDKSLYSGEGDRLPLDGSGTIVNQPPIVDVVLLEGWCVGFRSISRADLLSRWNGIWRTEREKLGLAENQIGRLIDIEAVNEKLKDYDRLWNYFDCFVQVITMFSTVCRL